MGGGGGGDGERGRRLWGMEKRGVVWGVELGGC